MHLTCGSLRNDFGLWEMPSFSLTCIDLTLTEHQQAICTTDPHCVPQKTQTRNFRFIRNPIVLSDREMYIFGICTSTINLQVLVVTSTLIGNSRNWNNENLKQIMLNSCLKDSYNSWTEVLRTKISLAQVDLCMCVQCHILVFRLTLFKVSLYHNFWK